MVALHRALRIEHLFVAPLRKSSIRREKPTTNGPPPFARVTAGQRW